MQERKKVAGQIRETEVRKHQMQQERKTEMQQEQVGSQIKAGRPANNSTRWMEV